MNNEETFKDRIRPASFWIGVSLVGFGAFSLLLLVVVVIEVIINPDNVMMMQSILSQANGEDLTISGEINKEPFEIRFSSEFKYLILALIVFMIVSIISTIVSALISGGIKLIRFSGSDTNSAEEKNKSYEHLP